MKISAEESLQRLIDGNKRFVSGVRAVQDAANSARRAEIVSDQTPFAIILGCSDSRVPAELVFDQGLGDLFVIRVAGNIVAPSQIASVEFAAERYGTQLVVVLGHSGCGAVQATLEAMGQANDSHSSTLRAIVDRIRPSLESVLEMVSDDNNRDSDRLLYHAVRANIRASVNQLKHGSNVLEQLILKDKLAVVGAQYSLESGEVDFFNHLRIPPTE